LAFLRGNNPETIKYRKYRKTNKGREPFGARPPLVRQRAAADSSRRQNVLRFSALVWWFYVVCRAKITVERAIDDAFEYHKCTPEQIAAGAEIRSALADAVKAIVGRQRSGAGEV
jgi:hypothetical protein